MAIALPGARNKTLYYLDTRRFFPPFSDLQTIKKLVSFPSTSNSLVLTFSFLLEIFLKTSELKVNQCMRSQQIQGIHTIFIILCSCTMETELSSHSLRFRNLNGEHNTRRFKLKTDCKSSWKEALGKSAARLASWTSSNSLPTIFFPLFSSGWVGGGMYLCVWFFLFSVKGEDLIPNEKQYPSVLLRWFGCVNV